MSADEANIINRVVRKSLFELAGNVSQTAMFTNLLFRVSEVKGADAQTILLGHEMAPSFLKTFARRGKSLIHQVVDEKTKDGKRVRLKMIAVTGAPVSQNTKKNLRRALIEEAKKAIAEINFDPLMQDVLHGKVSNKLFNRLKQITKMKRVEIRKSELEEIFN